MALVIVQKRDISRDLTTCGAIQVIEKSLTKDNDVVVYSHSDDTALYFNVSSHKTNILAIEDACRMVVFNDYKNNVDNVRGKLADEVDTLFRNMFVDEDKVTKKIAAKYGELLMAEILGLFKITAKCSFEVKDFLEIVELLDEKVFSRCLLVGRFFEKAEKIIKVQLLN
jgi:hypothetical protein